MHSDDFRRAVQALAAAGIIDWPQAYKAADDYQQQRAGVEREAAERALRWERPKPFMRLAMIEDPVLGVPLLFWVAMVGLLVTWIL